MRTTFYYREQKSKAFGKIGDKEIRDTFYIDSGADITLIPRSVGELIGLKIGNDKIIDLYGISGGNISVIVKKIRIRIGEHEFSIRVAWALTEKVPLILGRKDIFDKFNISFKEKEGIIEFEWVGD